MFVTFEGIDGSGKSTAMAAVAEALQGVRVWTTREETDRFGDAIRRSISQGADPVVTTYLFLADRFAHQPEIKRHLLDGELVLCDRYMHSTLAYQGALLAHHVPDHRAWLRALHAPLSVRPDRVLWFDLPAEVAIARATDRGEKAPYEKVEFLTDVAHEYAQLAEQEPDMIVRIDATGSKEEVAAAAIAAVTELLQTA